MNELMKLEITVGNSGASYRIGDVINSIDELASYFIKFTDHSYTEIADALEMYAKHMRE